MEGVPIGAALVWYWGVRALRLGGMGAALLLLALYVPLFPLYLYTGGRAIALIPGLILLALYHRFVRQFSVWWIAAGMLIILPVMSIWAEYRLTGALRLDSVSGMLSVITGDFSRFDITVAALAGAHEARMPPYWGETLLSALTLWLPSQLRPDLVDGTLALFRVLVGDPTSTVRSPYASTLVVEGYLNFRIAGVILFGYVLGRGVAVLDSMARSGAIMTVLVALLLTVRLPIAVSVDQGVLLIIRALLGPLLVSKGIQLILSVRRRPRRARSAPGAAAPLADASA